jgi:hypothetical protein
MVGFFQTNRIHQVLTLQRKRYVWDPFLSNITPLLSVQPTAFEFPEPPPFAPMHLSHPSITLIQQQSLLCAFHCLSVPLTACLPLASAPYRLPALHNFLRHPIPLCARRCLSTPPPLYSAAPSLRCLLPAFSAPRIHVTPGALR